MSWQHTRYTQDQLKRVTVYDYDEWLRSGYRLWDWDCRTGEYILAPLEANPMTREEAKMSV